MLTTPSWMGAEHTQLLDTLPALFASLAARRNSWHGSGAIPSWTPGTGAVSCCCEAAVVQGSVWGCLAAALISSGIHRNQSETEELWQKKEKTKRLRRSGNHKRGRNRQEQGENAARGGKKKSHGEGTRVINRAIQPEAAEAVHRLYALWLGCCLWYFTSQTHPAIMH